MPEDWTSSDWVAVVSLAVALTAIVSTALVAWLRMRHDERMQKERLAHERQEALTTTAAEGYAATATVLKVFDPDAPIPPAKVRSAAAQEARQPLEVIVAVGWSPEVRVAAMRLVAAVAALARKAYAMSVMESDSDPAAVGRARSSA
jgi:hypothetical protein